MKTATLAAQTKNALSVPMLTRLRKARLMALAMSEAEVVWMKYNQFFNLVGGESPRGGGRNRRGLTRPSGGPFACFTAVLWWFQCRNAFYCSFIVQRTVSEPPFCVFYCSFIVFWYHCGRPKPTLALRSILGSIFG